MPGPIIRIKVDDSALVALIKATAGKKPVRIVADGVEYGKYVEFGTTKTDARPAASNAVEAIRPSFVAAWRSVKNLADAEQEVQRTAEHVERLWKQNIIQMKAVDTGAYLSSIHVIKGERFEFEVGG